MTKLRPRLEELAGATGRLSPRQVEMIGGMLAEVDRLERRRTALAGACVILSDGQGLSRWGKAQRLESHLRRFEKVGMKRVLSGAREPTELEVHLLVLMESGPRCASKLWEEIRDIFPERR